MLISDAIPNIFFEGLFQCNLLEMFRGCGEPRILISFDGILDRLSPAMHYICLVS